MGVAQAVAPIDITGTAAARRTHVSELSDGALVDAYVEGDRRAFAALYERYHDRLLAFCRKRTRTPQVAEDVAHDVMVRALTYLEGFDRARPMWPWLKQIARNELADHYRASSREADITDGDLPEEDPAAHEHTVWLAERHALSQAMGHLSPRDRSVLTLRYCHDWDSAELQEMFDVERPALYKLLQRARERLHSAYDDLADSKLAGLLPAPLVGRVRAITDKVRTRLAGLESYLSTAPNYVEALASATAAAVLGVGLAAAGVAHASNDAVSPDNGTWISPSPFTELEGGTDLGAGSELSGGTSQAHHDSATASTADGTPRTPRSFSARVSAPDVTPNSTAAVHADVRSGTNERENINVTSEAEGRLGEEELIGNDRDATVYCDDTAVGNAACTAYEAADERLPDASG